MLNYIYVNKQSNDSNYSTDSEEFASEEKTKTQSEGE